jgi:transcriptional regulator with XRE-family HTH domain
MRASHNPALVKAFAAELKARRFKVGASQEGLALDCGVNRTFIAKLELAQNQPSLSVLLRLAEGLGVELPELLRSTLVRYKNELRTAKKASAGPADSSV